MAMLRMPLVLALLLAAFAAGLSWHGLRLADLRQDEALQRLSAPLARHIVGHWPALQGQGVDAADPLARERLIEMLMTVNPGIQVYTLDATGRVQHYFGEPGMVRSPQVDLAPVREFLAGAALPLRGSDPMGGEAQRLFSAAMFPARPGERTPPGYLYLVLDGPARQQAQHATRRWGALLLLPMLGATLLAAGLGAVWWRRQHKATRERALWQQERELATAHREHIAQLAHDLRTPLTALYGQLEGLAAGAERERALAHAERLRRLTQQLFELAALEAAQDVTQRERFALDELVSDTVQKFGGRAQLEGEPPGRLELEGDWQLVERALSNLIDNALRHTPGGVAVSLRREGRQACVRVRDDGPGLPAAVAERLAQGRSLRRPPLPRAAHEGLGGLGLAIAQRVAQLHGGQLRAEAASKPGCCLALALPLATS
jgi:signal transduction histidine kinase